MELTQVTAVPIIMAVVELMKNLGVPNRFLPIADVLLGIGAGFILFPDPVSAVVNGLVLGLTAAGLYRATQVTLRGK